MEIYNKGSILKIPDFLVLLDCFCPLCGSPISLKVVSDELVKVCSNPDCPYLEKMGNKEALGKILL